MNFYFTGECNYDPYYDSTPSDSLLKKNFSTGFQLFSQGCQDQMRLFFAGLFCSPNWPLYNHSNIFDPVVQDYVLKFSVCSRFLNSLFSTCRYEKLPASMINYIPRSRGFTPVIAGYNSNDTMVCTTFSEVFQTAVDFLHWADLAFSQNFTGDGYSSIFFLPYGLHYDTISTKTCFGAASTLSFNVGAVIFAFALILLSF